MPSNDVILQTNEDTVKLVMVLFIMVAMVGEEQENSLWCRHIRDCWQLRGVSKLWLVDCFVQTFVAQFEEHTWKEGRIWVENGRQSQSNVVLRH